MKQLIHILFAFICLNLTNLSANESNDDSLPSQICSPVECYTFIKQLGEGAFGKVFEVKDSKGRSFAIKSYKISPDLDLSFDFYQDAQREFLRGQLLKHPYIIASHDLFTSFSSSGESQTNIVLDLVEGQTLASIKKKELVNENAFKAAKQFISALEYALSQGFIHLDLHGGNIMLDHQKDIHVIDLASFFTFEEILSFVEKESLENDQQKTSGYPTQRQLVSTKPLVVSAHLKTEKLRKFFQQHRKLFKQLKNTVMGKNSRDRNLSLSKKINTPEESFEAYQSADGSGKLSIQSYYFNTITEICVSLITKSDLSRDEKINLRAEIKKIVWNYEEDIEEGTNLSLNAYLKELIETLQSG